MIADAVADVDELDVLLELLGNRGFLLYSFRGDRELMEEMEEVHRGGLAVKGVLAGGPRHLGLQLSGRSYAGKGFERT